MQLEERVVRLEKSGRRWRAAAGLLGICLIAGVYRGAANAPVVADEVKTHMLRVYDDKGNVIFLVGSSPDQTLVEIRRENKTAFSFQGQDGANIFALENPSGGQPQMLLSSDAKSSTLSFEPAQGAGNGTSTSLGSIRGAGFMQIRGGNGRKVFEKP